MNILEVKGLCKTYPGFRLDNVSFSVAPGSIMGFIGRNGAGKTTTLKSLLHIVHPDAGDIRPMSGHENLYRLRVGSYRVLYSVDGGLLIVHVLTIGNRGDVYK